MTNPFASRELTPTTGQYGPTPIASPNKVPAPVDPNALHMEGPMPSQVDFDARATVRPTSEPTPSTTETAEAVIPSVDQPAPETHETTEAPRKVVEEIMEARSKLAVLEAEGRERAEQINGDLHEWFEDNYSRLSIIDSSSWDFTDLYRNSRKAEDVEETRAGVLVGTDGQTRNVKVDVKFRRYDGKPDGYRISADFIDPSSQDKFQLGGQDGHESTNGPSFSATNIGFRHHSGTSMYYHSRGNIEVRERGSKDYPDFLNEGEKLVDFLKTATLKPAEAPAATSIPPTPTS